MGRPLTTRQKKTLGFMEEFQLRHGYPPTLREIGDGMGLSNVNAVRGHVTALEKKGYITRTPDKARSIQLVPQPSTLSRVKRRLHALVGTDAGVTHRVIYGLAWATRGRAPTLAGLAGERIATALEREAAEHGWELLDTRIEADHVVVVVKVWPNHSPERVVGRFQTAGKSVQHHYPDDFPTDALWDRGYAAVTDIDHFDEVVALFLHDADSTSSKESGHANRS